MRVVAFMFKSRYKNTEWTDCARKMLARVKLVVLSSNISMPLIVGAQIKNWKSTEYKNCWTRASFRRPGRPRRNRGRRRFPTWSGFRIRSGKQVSMLQNFFPSSLMTRPNKLEGLSLETLSSQVLEFKGKAWANPIGGPFRCFLLE